MSRRHESDFDDDLLEDLDLLNIRADSPFSPSVSPTPRETPDDALPLSEQKNSFVLEVSTGSEIEVLPDTLRILERGRVYEFRHHARSFQTCNLQWQNAFVLDDIWHKATDVFGMSRYLKVQLTLLFSTFRYAATFRNTLIINGYTEHT